MPTTTFNGIRIKGYKGKWSAVDSYTAADGAEYVLLENDYWGDETCYLVCRITSEMELEFICETFDDIETALKDCEVI